LFFLIWCQLKLINYFLHFLTYREGEQSQVMVVEAERE